MPGLFDELSKPIDITVSPTLSPRRARLDVITSAFPEPERPSEIAKVVREEDHAQKDQQLLEAVRASGSLGLSDGELAIKLRWPRTTVCSTRARVRLQLWIARRVKGEYSHPQKAWRIATPDEQARNEAHERQLNAAGKRWRCLDPWKDAR